MDELIDYGVRPIATVLRMAARILLWLGWDLGFQTIGWSIGWLICRASTFNYFPSEGIGGCAETHWAKALLVELIGLGFLGLMVLFLTKYVTGGA